MHVKIKKNTPVMVLPNHETLVEMSGLIFGTV